MTLTRALKIDENLLGLETREAMHVAERIWADRGSPRESKALADALEAILTVCQASGVQYPPILLRRKKELQRGEFFAEAPKAANGRCQLCSGAGWYTTQAGTGTLCDCGAWKKGV